MRNLKSKEKDNINNSYSLMFLSDMLKIESDQLFIKIQKTKK